MKLKFFHGNWFWASRTKSMIIYQEELSAVKGANESLFEKLKQKNRLVKLINLDFRRFQGFCCCSTAIEHEFVDKNPPHESSLKILTLWFPHAVCPASQPSQTVDSHAITCIQFRPTAGTLMCAPESFAELFPAKHAKRQSHKNEQREFFFIWNSIKNI